ncbi:MAG: DNA polymerase III subunit [Chlorobi bacterium]|nr:DNA polymerase III subunit [Chlorobiota bacterium]
MFFRDIKGHIKVKESLVRMPAENRVSHAYMFVGPEGSGKFPLALAFAQYLNCEAPVNGDSCGECASCKKYSKLVHPDLHFVFPVVKTGEGASNPVSDSFIREWRDFVLQRKYFNLTQWYNFIGAEKKQGMIYTQESQEIIKKLNLKTYEGRYKVMIIWLPEKMHPTASNKLLKILEEPPAGTVFILIPDNPEEVISTILSRTQQIRIPPFSTEELKEVIQEEYELNDEDAWGYARLANGNIVSARDIVEGSEDLDFFFENFVFLMRKAYMRSLQELVDWGDQMSRLTRDKQKSFFEYCLRLIRENYISNLKEDELVYLTPKERGFSEKFAPFINDNNAFQMAEEFSSAHSHISQNGNSRIIFMDLILKIIILIKNR